MKEPRAVDMKSKMVTRAGLANRLPPPPPRTLEPLNLSGSFGAVCKKGSEETTYTASTKTAFVKSAADVPPRHKEPRGPEVVSPSFSATSSLHQSTHSGIGEKDAGFFSRVRAVERQDDDVRHGSHILPTRSGAGRMQRTVDIMQRREHDPAFAPSREVYNPVERRTLNGVPMPTPLEQVHFTYTMPKSSQQIDYRTPTGQVPETLSPVYTAQRRAISESATSKDLFTATCKSRAAILPGSMSHVPANESTLAMLKGDQDVLRAYAQAGHLKAAKPGSIAAPPPERSKEAKEATTQGFYLEQAISFPVETHLNSTKCGKKSAVLN